MRVYAYDMTDEDGIVYGVSADAEDWDAAVEIARRKGWTLIAEYIDDVPPEIDAMIELRIHDPTIN